MQEWGRMTTNKNNTINKLRNQFVKEYPSMKKYYSEKDLDTDKEEKDVKVVRESKSVRESSGGLRAKNQTILKKMYFYSRSKKKCMSN